MSKAREIKGKRIAITGSTGGLGRELCAYLAARGASLVLVDRNAERSVAHRAQLQAQFAGLEVTCVTLDLEDITSAARAVEALIALEIDVFIHNAGAYSIPRHRCSTGYDNVFQINFATPYYMIRRLMPVLRARGGHVMVVGSIAHRYGRIDPQDVDFRSRKAASKVYGNAKRYLMFALFELFCRERGVGLAVTHPGITLTNITAHYPKAVYAVIKWPMKVIFMSPHKAARCLLAGVESETDYCQWIGPAVFDIWGSPRKKQLRSCSAAERRAIDAIADRVYRRCCRVAEKR